MIFTADNLSTVKMALSYSNKPKQASKPLSFPAFNTSCVWTMLPRILPACQDCVSFPRLCLKMTVFPQPSTVNRRKSSDCSACSSQTLSLSYNSVSLSETMMLLFSHLVNFSTQKLTIMNSSSWYIYLMLGLLSESTLLKHQPLFWFRSTPDIHVNQRKSRKLW